MANILILEPNRHLGHQMSEALRRAGYERTLVCCSVKEAAGVLREKRVMTVLNAQLPFTQSYDFMRSLAERGLPVLFVTADASNADHLRAMYKSDSDVLLSPFTAAQLTDAVQRLLRSSEKTLTLGGLRMDVEAKQVTKDGEPLALTTQEFALLQALMRSPDEAVSRQELLRTAWGYQSIGITRTVDVHVQRLRRKLGAASIETVYKTGYRLRLT